MPAADRDLLAPRRSGCPSEKAGAAPKVGYSPEFRGIGFFNFAPIEPLPPPEAPKPANTDGYPPYPSMPAWPAQ
jgi:hypothetical protein